MFLYFLMVPLNRKVSHCHCTFVHSFQFSVRTNLVKSCATSHKHFLPVVAAGLNYIFVLYIQVLLILEFQNQGHYGLLSFNHSLLMRRRMLGVAEKSHRGEEGEGVPLPLAYSATSTALYRAPLRPLPVAQVPHASLRGGWCGKCYSVTPANRRMKYLCFFYSDHLTRLRSFYYVFTLFQLSQPGADLWPGLPGHLPRLRGYFFYLGRSGKKRGPSLSSLSLSHSPPSSSFTISVSAAQHTSVSDLHLLLPSFVTDSSVAAVTEKRV